MRLVFSSIRTDSRPMTVDGILRSSRRNNPRDGITGALLSDSSRFVQLLEGERAGVDRCFARIQRDRRHRDITVLVAEETREILFPDAPMCSVEAGDREPVPVAATLSGQASPARVMETFRALARHDSPAPDAVPEAGAALVVLRRIHLAARQVLDDHLNRSHIPPETLERLAASLARQAAQARDLHRRLATAACASPEHRIEAQRLCEFLEAAERDAARRLDRRA